MWNSKKRRKLLDVFGRGLCLSVEYGGRRYLIASDMVGDLLETEPLVCLRLEQRLCRRWQVGVLGDLLRKPSASYYTCIAMVRPTSSVASDILLADIEITGLWRIEQC